MLVADTARGLVMTDDQGASRVLPCAPLALCEGGGRVFAACRDGVLCLSREGEIIGQYRAPPGTVRLSFTRGRLFALSQDADALHMLSPNDGKLLVCARAGCYPRDMAQSPCGDYLLVAAGADGCLILFECGALRETARYHLPGMVVACCFARGGMHALCVPEDRRARLYRVTGRRAHDELMTFDTFQGALCACPQGGLLAGVRGACLWLDEKRRVLLRAPCGLPARIRVKNGSAYVADALHGTVLALRPGAKTQVVYKGVEAADML